MKRKMKEVFWAVLLAVIFCWTVREMIAMHEDRMHAQMSPPALRIDVGSLPMVYFKEVEGRQTW